MPARSLALVRAAARGLTAVVLLATLAAFPRPAGALGVPSPVLSEVPDCLPLCPAGDLEFSVVVRDIIGAPIANSTVELDLRECVGFVVLPCSDCAQAAGWDPAQCRFRARTDGAGRATFRLCGSIRGPEDGQKWVQVIADGVILGNSSFVTPDVDLDGEVDATDVAIVTAAEGGTQPQFDQDCDGLVGPPDAALVSAHLGHMCPESVPAAPTTWGSIKAVYRPGVRVRS